MESFTYPSGNVYSGHLSGRKRHGQGTLRWVDGAQYTGQWSNDECQGQGTMRFPNGSVFEGNWVRNNPYGQGQLTTINQELLVGFWEFHGRSDQTAAPVGKYVFRGELVDLKNGERRQYNGPLALYLTSGLVSLPNMADPLQALLPYAEVIADAQAAAPHDEKSEKGAVPIAQAIQTAPTSSSSISYGQPDVAFKQRHPDDHFAVDLADPRVYLAGLGVPVNPANVNARRQAEIRAMESAQMSTIQQAQPVNRGADAPY